MEQYPKANKNFELVLSIEDDGIVIEFFKKQPNKGLMKLDYRIDDQDGFKLLKKILKELSGIDNGTLLYTGDKTINEVNMVLVSLGFIVGIEQQKPKTKEEKISKLERKLKDAVEEEEYMEAARIRDEINILHGMKLA